MRKVEYLSPTSIGKYLEDTDDFYKNYLFDIRLPRDPQTKPMSIGSSLDAYVKSHLHNILYGPTDPKFKFDTLFEAQVEPHNRDWALTEGKYLFEEYKRLGCIDDALVQIQHAGAEPRFEVELRGAIGDAVLLGKPDFFYKTTEDHPVILDFKVNAYCSKWSKSPDKHYLRIRGDSKKTTYPQCVPGYYKGIQINTATTFETVNQPWCAQLCVYAWLLGSAPGSDFVVAIDQFVCNGSDGHELNPSRPDSIKVAEHRMLVGKKFQIDYFNQVQTIWKAIQSGHIYQNLSLADSQERCRQMDESLMYLIPGSKLPETKSGRQTY